MVRVPTDIDDPEDADGLRWRPTLFILHGGIVVALVVYCVGWV